MANIKGITIEIDGNTTKLQKALEGTNKSLKTTQSSLKDVNKLLKMDPGNVTLLKQKQDLLKKSIEDTKTKLDKEKEALRQLKAADQSPEVKAQMEALERQIIEDEQALKSLTQQQKEFGSVAKQQLKVASDQMKQFGASLTSAGEGMTKSVTAPIMAVGAASLAAFSEVDKGYDILVQKTGATGEAAQELRDIMEHLATTIPTDFETAGNAVGEVATRFGVTGDELEELSSQFIKFAQINNTDVTTSIDSVQKALAAYGLGAEDAADYLDTLNKTGQDTGVSVDKLAAGIVQNATAFQEMGLSIEDATAFMGHMEKSGVNMETVMQGMRKALKSAAKEGKPLNQALAELQDSILNGTDGMDGLNAAYELFGKSGDQIYAAVQSGALDFTALAGAAEDAAGSVTNTFNETLDPMDQFKMTMNDLKIVGAEVGSTILEMVAPALEKFRDFIMQLKEKWDGLSPEAQKAIVIAAGIAAAIGPVLVILGTLATAIGALMSPIGLVVVAIAAAIAAGVALYQNWDSIVAWAGTLKENVIAAWEELKASIGATITALKEQAAADWEAIKTSISTTVENIKTTLSTTWETIKTTVSTTIETIKTTLSTAWDSIKSTVSTTWETIKSTISTTIETIKTNISTTWETIKSTVSTAVENVKTSISTAFESALSTVTTIFDSIYTAITDKIGAARDFVGGAIEAIKGFFNFQWSLPHLSLPHIVVDSYADIPILGTIPTGIHVEWYKKAYETPYLFTSPTIIGGRGFGDGGGTGEIVYGRSQLMRDIAQVAGERTNIINVYAAEGMDINALADRIQDRLVQLQRQEEAVYA